MDKNASTEHTRAPDDAFIYNGHTLHWTAKSDCELRGGQLAVIDQTGIQAVLQDLLPNLTSEENVWIGLSYSHSVDNWQWVNGKKCSKIN